MMVLVILLLAIVVAMQDFINFASCGWYGKATPPPPPPPPPRKGTSATPVPPQKERGRQKGRER